MRTITQRMRYFFTFPFFSFLPNTTLLNENLFNMEDDKRIFSFYFYTYIYHFEFGKPFQDNKCSLGAHNSPFPLQVPKKVQK